MRRYFPDRRVEDVKANGRPPDLSTRLLLQTIVKRTHLRPHALHDYTIALHRPGKQVLPPDLRHKCGIKEITP